MSCVLFSPPNHDMTWGDPEGEYVRIINNIHCNIRLLLSFNLKFVSSHIYFNFTFFKRNVLEEVSLVTDKRNNSTDAAKQSKKMKWRAESFLVAGNLSILSAH